MRNFIRGHEIFDFLYRTTEDVHTAPLSQSPLSDLSLTMIPRLSHPVTIHFVITHYLGVHMAPLEEFHWLWRQHVSVGGFTAGVLVGLVILHRGKNICYGGVGHFAHSALVA